MIGLSPILIRMSELGPQATNFWRFEFALPILGAWAMADKAQPSRADLRLLAVAGVLFALELGLWATALSFTTVVNATLLSNLTPLVAAAAGWVLFKEKLKGLVLAGGATALAGAVLLTLARAHAGQGPSGEDARGLIGDALGFSSAFGYAAYLIIVRALGGRVGAGAIMFWATLSATACALIAALALKQDLLAHSVIGWAILIANGVLVQAAGQGLIAYGVGRLPIAISTILLWIQPLAAAVLSWILFYEKLTPLAFVAAALILGGVYAVQRARNAPPSTSQAEAT